jgi:CubicO group peptidase (beta-lactamase class C family)
MRKRFIALFSAICAGLFIAPVYARAVETDAFKNDVTAFIEGKLKESNVAGLTLAFVDLDKGLVWTEGFGYADVKNKTKVTDKSIFKIASISKTFTMMALMQLCEAGKIKLDDPVVKYVPGFAIKPHPARGGRAGDRTIDRLAKHRSGILGDFMPGGR